MSIEAPKSEIRVRRAVPEDRATVLGFCTDTFSWGDYIADVWDDWLAAENGLLMVAELDGVPVAIQNVSFPAEGEVYLKGMRVDPAVRRRGIATTMLDAGLALARERGARVLRLMTKTDNGPVQHMMEVAGFRRLTTYTDLRAPADLGCGPAIEAAVAAERDDLWQWLAGSEAFVRGERVYLRGWEALTLTPERLASHLDRREALVVRKGGKAAALALVERWEDEPSLWVSTLAGQSEALRELARGLRTYAGRVAGSEVTAYVPLSPETTEPLHEAGFRAEGKNLVPDMDLFAKDL